jgi:hypothetical protein
MGLETRVRRLEDREAIKELKYEYGRCIDHRRWDGLVDLFAADATCTYEGIGTFEGHDELRELADEFIAENFVYSCHTFHHPSIHVDDASATGTWLLEALMAYHDGRIEWRQGRYEERYRLVDGEWRFDAITLRSEAQGYREYELIDHEAYGSIPRID